MLNLSWHLNKREDEDDYSLYVDLETLPRIDLK